ncbi:hypothetical protein HJC23_013842 [Cyclotella cryptica]|uniref:Uncharacterized protein n=1 Tax=Cyclotella cryptica TaxID=29204 RepID=A0ABD3PAV2_9STRA|eukprot:CCRYP_016319-RB/>CCRYP_016319-RB protein AED:0.05 eAED:0.05 QI:488/1/1/1/1/1/4/166/678
MPKGASSKPPLPKIKEDEPSDDNDHDEDASPSQKRPRDDKDQDEPDEEASSKGNSTPPLRRGKWTPEEEAYASRLIVEFKAGLLPLTDGTTLRTFLSKLLNCDPMRISKKFVGSNCIGKQVFRRRSADVSSLTPEQIQRTRMELSELEKRFLDRVTKGVGGKAERQAARDQSPPGERRPEKKIKLSEDQGATSLSMVGALGAGLTTSGSLGNMNRSAAAAGRALLQGGNGANGKDGGAGNAGLLAQLQESQPGMFDPNNARSFNASSAPSGAVGLNIPSMGSSAALGKMNPPLDINALMLQTGLTPEQISQLAHNKVASSASLANMLGKKRSFDGLMSLDFQSMQSIDNLANLIQHGMPKQASTGQMKNWDWNNGSAQAGLAGMQNFQGGLGLGLSSSMLGLNHAQNAVNTASQGLGNQSNAAFGDLIGNYHQSSLYQNLQNASQQQQRHLPQQSLGQLSQLQSLTNANPSLLHGMGNANAGANSLDALLQSVQNKNNNSLTGGNDFGAFSSLMGLPGGNLPQQNLMSLNNSFGGGAFAGLPQHGGNSMMAALAAQQQMLSQAKVGGGSGMNGLFPQQSQFTGLGGFGGGMGGMGGLDLASLNLSDPNTASLVQQLLAQQGQGGSLSGLGSMNQQTQAQVGKNPFSGGGEAGAAPQANISFDQSNGRNSQIKEQSTDV